MDPLEYCDVREPELVASLNQAHSVLTHLQQHSLHVHFIQILHSINLVGIYVSLYVLPLPHTALAPFVFYCGLLSMHAILVASLILGNLLVTRTPFLIL